MKKFLNEVRFRLLIWAIRQWTENKMDQFEYLSLKTKWGKLYVHMSYMVEHPEIYDEVK
jgi:hypothetical protein